MSRTDYDDLAPPDYDEGESGFAPASVIDDIPDFEAATRTKVGLLVGVWGESGSGKSLSALLIGRGMAAEPGEDLTDPDVLAKVDARIAYIDTDGARARHYAVAPGQKPTNAGADSTFAFAHANFKPPFTPERMSALVARAERAGFKVIIIDSFSLIWEGEGGVKDIKEATVEKAVERARRKGKKFDEDKLRDNAAHWNDAKTRNRKMVQRMLQARAHLIFCGHADDKMRMEPKEKQFTKTEGGVEKVIKYTTTEITPAEKLAVLDRWVPICEKKFPRQLVLSLVITPEAPGVPHPKKMSAQHRPFVHTDRTIDVQLGLDLAAWARGATREELRPGMVADGQGKPTPAAAAIAAGVALDDDAFPGDGVKLWDVFYQPREPEVLPHYNAAAERELTPAEWQHWAKAFRELTRLAAPDDRAQWAHTNRAPLLLLHAASPALWGWAREHVPASPPTADEQTRSAATSRA